MTLTSRLHRTRQEAAKLRLAASSVAPVPAGYERSLRPCHASFSQLASTIQTGGQL